MKQTPATELQGFHDFIAELLQNGSADMSPEEALDAWRARHPDLLDFEDDLEAIKAALHDRDRGEKGMSFEEFDRQMRKKYNLSDPPYDDLPASN